METLKSSRVKIGHPRNFWEALEPEKTSSRSSARPKTKHGRFRTVPGSQVTRTNDSFRVVQSLSSSFEPFIERFVCVPFMYTHSDSSCALLKDEWPVALVEAAKHKASAFMVISH